MLCLHNCCVSKPHLINTSHSRILFSETQLIINPLNVLLSANKYIPSLLLSLNSYSICFISSQFLPIFKVEINIILYCSIMFLKTNFSLEFTYQKRFLISNHSHLFIFPLAKFQIIAFRLRITSFVSQYGAIILLPFTSKP